MNRQAYMAGYMHKEAVGGHPPDRVRQEQDRLRNIRNIPVREIPGYHKGMTRDPGSRITGTYAAGMLPAGASMSIGGQKINPNAKPYFQRARGLNASDLSDEVIAAKNLSMQRAAFFHRMYVRSGALSDKAYMAERGWGPALTDEESNERIRLNNTIKTAEGDWLRDSDRFAELLKRDKLRLGKKHASPITEQHVQDIRKSLPGMATQTTLPMDAIRTIRDVRRASPSVSHADRRMVIPSPGSAWGLPVALHEYTHATDPFAKYRKTIRGGLPSGVGDTYEPEMPAMVTERAVEGSPHYTKNPRTFATPYGKQIQKHGPHLSGDFKKDLGNIRSWVGALRSVPGTGIPSKSPFGYKQDPRTEQQRASSLGKAYQNWMNFQVDNEPKAAE